MSERKSFRTHFEKGVMEYLEPSRVPEGFAVSIKNWTPEADGSLRVRVGWDESGETSAPATRACKGLVFSPKTDKYLFLNRKSGTLYTPYSIPKANLASGTWTAYSDITVSSTAKYVSGTFGLGYVFFSTDEFSKIQKWDGTAISDTTDSKPGRALLVWKNRLFTGGGPETTPDTGDATQVYRLWYSDLGDSTGWTTGNYIDVKADDGEPIECITAFDNGMLIGKENSVHYLTGSGPASFNLQELEGAGCAPGRSICATPYGAVIAGRTQVYLWKGVYPEPISKPISSSYGLTGEFLTTAYIDGKVYIADQGSGVTFVFDLEAQAWSVEEVTGPTTAGPVALITDGEFLLGGVKNSTSQMMWFRQFPDGTREPDQGLAMEYLATTPEYWLAGAAAPVTIRNVYIRLRQRAGQASEEPLVVTFLKDGEEVFSKNIFPEEPGVRRRRLDFGGTAYYVQFQFQQQLLSGQSSAYDVEEVEVLYDEEELR